MEIYTIAFATRLKRRVFRAKNIPPDVEALVNTYLSKNGKKPERYIFCDYGMVLSIGCENAGQAGALAAGIRRATSKPVRSLYPELWSMPSLWNSRPLILKGGTDEKNMTKIREYYESLKSR